jgi:hypothetical protein
MGQHHGEARLRVVHLVAELVVPAVRVDRYHPRAEGVEREIVEEELGPVLEEEPHAMPVAVARRGVAVAQGEGLGPHLRVRVLHAVRMIGAARRRRCAEEGVIGRRRRRRHECLEDASRHG